MSTESNDFLAIVRAAYEAQRDRKLKAAHQYRLYCPCCDKQQPFEYDHESASCEWYRCVTCKTLINFRVR